MFTSVGQALKTRSFASFTNENNEYISASYYYQGTTKKYCVNFGKSFEKPSKYPINTTSEKKVLSILNEGNFKFESH